MTVAEIKAKLPEAEVYELNNDSKYLIVCNMDKVPKMSAECLSGVFNGALVFVLGPVQDAVAILEIKET